MKIVREDPLDLTQGVRDSFTQNEVDTLPTQSIPQRKRVKVLVDMHVRLIKFAEKCKASMNDSVTFLLDYYDHHEEDM